MALRGKARGRRNFLADHTAVIAQIGQLRVLLAGSLIDTEADQRCRVGSRFAARAGGSRFDSTAAGSRRYHERSRSVPSDQRFRRPSSPPRISVVDGPSREDER
jgi:hypothetical protein